MDIKSMLHVASTAISDNLPEILTGLSIGGVILTAVNASKATIVAQDILYGENIPEDPKAEFQATWKCYIPTVISGAATVGLIIGARCASARQTQAMASAYLLTQSTLQAYQEKVVEKIGERKANAIREDARVVVADRQAPPTIVATSSKEACDTGHGNTLFYDLPSDTYFRSDVNYIKTKFRDINDYVRDGYQEDYRQNEILAEIGLPGTKYGMERGINATHKLDPHFNPELMENGDVRIVLDYELWSEKILKER